MTIRDRHDAIIRSLRRKGVSTVDELAKEVGISRRTILRDICALRDQGFTIYSEPGRGGGLQLDPQSVQTTNCRSQTLLTLGFPKLRKHSLRTKFESSANSCAAFTLENCLRSRMPLI